MADPHGWNAQNEAIRAKQAAAREQNENDLHAGGVALVGRQPAEPQPRKPPPVWPEPPASSAPHAMYSAAVAYCQNHNVWGCAYRQSEMRRALYEAHSAASRHGSEWCKDLKWISQTAGFILSPGYVMVFRNQDGTIRWGSGRSQRQIRRKLRDHLGPDAEVVLLLSVCRGVLVNHGLDLQIGWTKDMPGGM